MMRSTYINTLIKYKNNQTPKGFYFGSKVESNGDNNSTPKPPRKPFFVVFFLASIICYVGFVFYSYPEFDINNINNIELLTKIVFDFETVALVAAWGYYFLARKFDNESLEKAIAITFYVELLDIIFVTIYAL